MSEEETDGIIAGGKTTRTRGKFGKWIREPASWLSVIAMVVSVVTLYLVHLNPGSVVVVLGREVGASLDGPTLYVPMTFTNTSASRITRHVASVTAVVTPGRAGAERSFQFQWRREAGFVGAEQYAQIDADYDPGDSRDVYVYAGRAFPFALNGGASESKVLELDLVSQSDGEQAEFAPDRFDLQVNVETLGGEVVVRHTYRCTSPLSGSKIIWCGIR